MSREIKFRAWEKRTCRMREVSGFFFGQVMFISPQENATSYTINSVPEDQVELMQYTGLKDKNGAEVYEGDIVKAELHRSYLMPHEHNPQVLEVAYEEDMTLSPFHTLVGYDGERWANVLVDGFEVIGNIYENPELLKKDGDA